MDRIAVPCCCGCSVALVMEFDQMGADPQEFFIEFFTSCDPKVSRRNRWQTAWRVFRGKDPWLHDVCLSPVEATQFKEFLDRKLS